ncbi:hypothetical protein CLU79DRAFT_841748 [Phycomyces nitens]|nr:hypothetical protein CLU79DRAFT_841748 [Phycomyces nitens]
MEYKYDGPKRTHVRTDADYQQYTVKIESKVRNQCIQRMPTEYLIRRQSLMDTNDKIIRYEYDESLRITNERKHGYRRTTVNDERLRTTTKTLTHTTNTRRIPHQTSTISGYRRRKRTKTNTNFCRRYGRQGIKVSEHIF